MPTWRKKQINQIIVEIHKKWISRKPKRTKVSYSSKRESKLFTIYWGRCQFSFGDLYWSHAVLVISNKNTFFKNGIIWGYYRLINLKWIFRAVFNHDGNIVIVVTWRNIFYTPGTIIIEGSLNSDVLECKLKWYLLKIPFKAL